MRCFRIMSESFFKTPFAASGNAGRWNPKGIRMIYAASAPSVALLEYLCIRGNAVGKKPWYMIVYEIKDESLVASLDPSALPADWAALPHPRATQEFGKLWIESNEEPFLEVPSSRISLTFFPMEFNLLINPDYPELSRVMKVVDVVEFSYLLGST